MGTQNVINIKRVSTSKQASEITDVPDLSILTEDSKHGDLEDLYGSTFYEIVMNVRGRYDANQYDTILSIISPSLSYKFTTLYPKRAESLISEYCKICPQDKEFLQNMPDKPSALNHVFLYFFKEFYKSVKEKGKNEALDVYQDFFFTNEEVFKTLPVAFVFSLVNFVEKK